jgi:hypothetical protein
MASLGSGDTTLYDKGSPFHSSHILLHGKDSFHDTLLQAGDILRRAGDYPLVVGSRLLLPVEGYSQVKGFLLRALDIHRRNSLSLAGNYLPTEESR